MGEENGFGQVGVWLEEDVTLGNDITDSEENTEALESISGAITEDTESTSSMTGVAVTENESAAVNEKEDGNEAVPEWRNTVEITIENERCRRRIPTFFRMLRVVLVICGIMAYLIPGILLIGGMKDGGLLEFSLWQVYGSAEKTVEVTPLEPETDVPPDEMPPTMDENGVVSVDLSCDSPYEVFNETGYNIDEETVSTMADGAITDEGAVLIIHTHGTEAYLGSGEDFRSEDTRENVVAVGDEFARVLQERGIKVYHCREMFDRYSYIDSYMRSGETVLRYLREYPNISYVIDIHRDAVIRESGDVVRSDGGTGAQLMIVCGTDEKGADFPLWRENLAFGVKYQRELFNSAENFVRPINLRGASFNEQLAKKYLLLEVGTCGNTLEEALDSAGIAAEAFSRIILDTSETNGAMDNCSQKS